MTAATEATELARRLRGRRIVASISGGKDSAAMSLFLKEHDIEHERVFMDTSWEHPLTYEYLRGELTCVIGPIVEIRAVLTMEELILKKGMFPSRHRRFCTEMLKVQPMRAYLAALDAEVVNCVGIRREESAARAALVEWEWSDTFDCEVWRPILTWTLDDVIAIHRRHGLKPNPLYLLGASRVGCWPCIMARKSEIRLVADETPERIDRIRELERAVGSAAHGRYQRRLRVLQEHGPEALTAQDRAAMLLDDGAVKPFSPPSWFQSRLKAEGGLCWPIDRVVEWSRTVRGGREENRQVESFDAADEGCVRWGVCDTVGAEEVR